MKPVTVGREERGGGGGIQTCEQLRVVAVVTVEGAGALDFNALTGRLMARCSALMPSTWGMSSCWPPSAAKVAALTPTAAAA